MSRTLIAALLLCNLSWIQVSLSESQTMEVQPGEEVTVLCTNISNSPSATHWFRLVNGSKPSCISSMFSSDVAASFCEGFQNGKFEMTSNVSTVFLKIKQMDLSDSGLYFCGMYQGGHIVIVNATFLKVQGNDEFDDEEHSKTKEEPNGITSLICLILGGVTVFLIMVIIGLVLKIWTLHRAVKEEQQPQRSETLDSNDLNYAAVTFHPKKKRSRRPASDKVMEPHVVYAATR